MDPGKYAVFAGLATSVAAFALYLGALRGGRRPLAGARLAFGLAAAATVFCFGRLMWLVAGKQFQYQYVFDYVSRDLHGSFLYAATWAGQEGSFLLWAVWTAVIGCLVAWKAGRWEPRVMVVYVTVLATLFGVLAWLSPYNVIPRGGGPNDYPLDLPWPPTDGKGLNPSLQNYWMAIHPPTIFFGFASLAVPFCYACAAMLWREYESWSARVMPWALLSMTTLGMGLFLGGYWAYETLGWHGFWAWDPVENASLFPWLGTLALVHGLVVQKSRGGMARTNLFLAIASWLMFLYGTYLTRSGALANFSVHAFGMLDNPALKLLLAMIAVYGIGGMALLAVRWRGVPGRPIADRLLSRDTAMVLAVTLMVAASIVVVVGTSWPIVSQWRGWKAVPALAPHLYAERGMTLERIFYNRVGSILLIPTLLLLGMVPFLAWGRTNADRFLWRLLLPWWIAIAGGGCVLVFVKHEAAIGFVSDTPKLLVLVIATLGLFAAAANVLLAVRVLRARAVTLGGWLSHVGMGLLFVGVVLTNVYEKTESFALLQGAPPVRTPFGYSLQYAGWTDDGKGAQESQADWWRFDHAVRIRVIPTRGSEADSQGFVANAPVFYHRQLAMSGDDGPQTMRWPYIHKEWHRDLYVAVASDPQLIRASATLRPGETSLVAYPGMSETGYRVRYRRFYMDGGAQRAGTVMGAEMDLITPTGRSVPIRPGLRLGGEAGPTHVNIPIRGVDGAVILQGGLNAATKEVTAAFELPGAPAMWMIPLAVTNKPAINLVWLGVALVGIGGMIAMLRRALEARRGRVVEAAVAAGAPDEPEGADTASPPRERRPARATAATRGRS